MRLWHYKLIQFLPRPQLLSQWRELCSIIKKKDNHILINYVYEYDDSHLIVYSYKLIHEMLERGYKVKKLNYNDAKYSYAMTAINEYIDRYNELKQDFEHPKIIINFKDEDLFVNHHNNRYLLQCFYNLQEKYDRGQKGFSKDEYNKLVKFMKEELAWSETNFYEDV